ncbi:MAG: hypothetical protein ACLFV2_05390 [Desulfurivibrionaceae bacterium]
MFRLLLFFFLIVWLSWGAPMSLLIMDQIGSARHNAGQAWAGETFQGEDNNKDIQWFKKTMNIAPKYQEERSGILGMSWTHFIVMVFLIIFVVAAIINYYARSRRSKKIVLNLMQNEKTQQS